MKNVKDKTNTKTGDAFGKLPLFFGLFLCLFQLFISYPIAIWTRNKFNFEAPLTYSYSVLGLTFFVIIVFSIFIALLTPRKLRNYLTPILILLAAAIFIQQNFMAWNYGILDGHTLDFKKNTSLGFLDLALWVIAFFALFLIPKLIKRQSANILLAIGAITGSMTGLNITNYGPVKTPYAIDESAKFEFSRTKNIIVFLFDAYQIDYLLELSDKFPELMEPFEGFTNYENNAAVFAKTYPTIPLFLTGKRYQKKEPILDFFKTAYEGSLMERMQDEGWDIGLYPQINSFPSLINAIDVRPGIMDNVVGGVPSDAKIKTYLQALDLSFFRAVPHALKPAVFNNGNFTVNKDKAKAMFMKALDEKSADETSQNDKAKGESDIPQPFKYKHRQRHDALGFRDLINEHGVMATDDPVFRFYHFNLPHAPFYLDRDLNDIAHVDSLEAYREYSIAALKLMGLYLNRLKEIGAYDNSTILIVSDHGLGQGNAIQYDSVKQDFVKSGKYGYRRSAAKSIFLMKPAKQRGALSRSAAPVSGVDLAPSIAAAAGIKIGNFEGKDVLKISETEARSRVFNFYTFSTWDSKYLEDFENYEIIGDVRDQSSWNRVGMITESVKVKNKKTYKIGQVMSFGEDIKSDSDFLNAFIDLDKYGLQPNYIEAENGTIDVAIKLKTPPNPGEPLLLQFEIYSGEAVDRKIVINGEEFTTFIKPKRRELNRGFFISPDVHKGAKVINLSFNPLDTETARPLRLSSIKLSVLKPEEIEEKTNFLENFDEYFPVEFKQKEKTTNLPVNRVGSLIFKAKADICNENNLQLKFKNKPIGQPKLVLNDTPLELISPIEEASRAFSYKCAMVKIKNSNVLEVSLSKAKLEEIINKDDLTVELQEISFNSSYTKH